MPSLSRSYAGKNPHHTKRVHSKAVAVCGQPQYKDHTVSINSS